MRSFAAFLAILWAVSASAEGPRRLPFFGAEGFVPWEATDAELGLDPALPRNEAIRRLVDALVRWPHERSLGPSITPLYPRGTMVDSVLLVPPDVVVRITLPAGFLASGAVDDEWLERLSWQLIFALDDESDIRQFHIVARDGGRPGAEYRPLPSYLPPVDHEALKKEVEGGEAESRAPLVRRRAAGISRSLGDQLATHGGALTGKQVFFSQCHGWLDYTGADAWETQRGITNSIVEDFVNPEAVDQYLLRYLENAGADVFTLRENDMNDQMVTIDSEDGVAFPANGTYVEGGNAGAFANSPNVSWGNFQAPYTASEDPFRITGNNDRLITTTSTRTAWATYTPVIPKTGYYNVYVSYTRNGSLRASDAHYTVYHTGGATEFEVNQERHGWVWVFLGRFRFDAGSNPTKGSVELANDSAEVGQTVSADAVRFGGGMGDIVGENHATLSGRPRWEEGARTYTQYQGASSTVWGAGDVSGRSRFAEWENYAGIEDSIYVSWHSNAFDTTARGTTSYIYSSNPPDGSYLTTEAVAGSRELMEIIHDEMVNDIRGSGYPTWQNRGYKSAYFGEINPANNAEMPSCLLEVAFHDNASDAAMLVEPKMRNVLARSVYQGIVKYFANRDGLTPRLLPEPPQAPEAHALDATTVRLSWLAPATDGGGVLGDAATGYRVYRSSDGRGFDNGVAAATTTVDITGLAQGSLWFFRVTAENLGGESLPSETLAVRMPDPNDKKVLLVSAFDRLDASLLPSISEPDLGGSVKRMFLDRVNTFDYVVEHAVAMAGENIAIDSAANEAVATGRVALAGYQAVDWICGEESTVDESVSTTEQSAVATYLSGGGSLFLTGAEVGWDLDNLGSAGDKAFYEGTVGANYVSDDAGTYTGAGVAGSILAGVTAIDFDDGTHGTYDANYPDVIGPASGSGAISCLTYSGGAVGGLQRTNGNARMVTFGFPFETIWNVAKRQEVMSRVLDFLVPCVAPTLALTVSSVTKAGSSVTLSMTDPNPASSITGYDVYRSSSPAGPWTLVGDNVSDENSGAAGVQWTNDPGSAIGLWCYKAMAFNNRCSAEGP